MSAVTERMKKDYFEKHPYECHMCGMTKGLELHHIIPLAKGGANNVGNLICLCTSCHKKIHSEDRGTLVKLGLMKRTNQRNLYIKVSELYQWMNDVLMAGDNIKVEDILDYIDYVAVQKDKKRGIVLRFKEVEYLRELVGLEDIWLSEKQINQ